ncbi:MAG: ribonuclease [Devosia sp.]|uniref:ribonuclease T2 family protein n=1 Tax=Devosia sp. TaxID=1871048 RepID=UPI0024C9548F|nr:ribonuclease [Devosia sp.]UYO00938.1 MAG: ribonuclease [Devosia sp.]
MPKPVFVLALALSLVALPVHAEVPLTGSFNVTETCPAYQSISRETNPGNIEIRPGETYDLLAANKTPATHVRIEIAGASPAQRWVEVDCGTTGQPLSQPEDAAPVSQTYRGTQYILAANWQPAFCELNTRVRECRDQHPNSFEATNFTLHGLWPQPRDNEYCDVSERDRWASIDGRWRDLPALDLTIAQRRELDEVMPGSLSGLDRHEWVKHGSCYDGDQRAYIGASLDLMLALNASEVSELFAGNTGRRITLVDIRSAFDRAFGPGAGERVAIDCEPDGNRTLITELRIALTGKIAGPDDFADLILAADPLDSACRSGQVDAVGLR